MRCNSCSGTSLLVDHVSVFIPEADKLCVVVRCFDCHTISRVTFWASVAGPQEVKDAIPGSRDQNGDEAGCKLPLDLLPVR